MMSGHRRRIVGAGWCWPCSVLPCSSRCSTARSSTSPCRRCRELGAIDSPAAVDRRRVHAGVRRAAARRRRPGRPVRPHRLPRRSGSRVRRSTSAYAGDRRLGGRADRRPGLMGVGAALIFPATLAIITNMFPDPSERAKAIGIWSAVGGIGVAAGPITGGWLLEHFWWGSVFFVNVPIVDRRPRRRRSLRARVEGPRTPALDPLGAAAVDRGDHGARVHDHRSARVGLGSTRRSSPASPSPRVLLGAFVVVGAARRSTRCCGAHLREPALQAASVSITLAFFALFGFVFLITQYFQLVRGYTPLEAGVRTLPRRRARSPSRPCSSPLVVQRFGTKTSWSPAVSPSMARRLRVGVDRVSVDTRTSRSSVRWSCSASASASPRRRRPSRSWARSPDKAGVGSAVNDTTRELGGTLGVAVVGAMFSSVYVSSLAKGPIFSSLTPDVQAATRRTPWPPPARSLGASAPKRARIPHRGQQRIPLRPGGLMRGGRRRGDRRVNVRPAIPTSSRHRRERAKPSVTWCLPRCDHHEIGAKSGSAAMTVKFQDKVERQGPHADESVVGECVEESLGVLRCVVGAGLLRATSPDRPLSWAFTGAGCEDRTRHLMITSRRKPVRPVSGDAVVCALIGSFAICRIGRCHSISADFDKFVGNPWARNVLRVPSAGCESGPRRPTPPVRSATSQAEQHGRSARPRRPPHGREQRLHTGPQLPRDRATRIVA